MKANEICDLENEARLVVSESPPQHFERLAGRFRATRETAPSSGYRVVPEHRQPSKDAINRSRNAEKGADATYSTQDQRELARARGRFKLPPLTPQNEGRAPKTRHLLARSNRRAPAPRWRLPVTPNCR
eukprot:tig00000432_g695.t1